MITLGLSLHSHVPADQTMPPPPDPPALSVSTTARGGTLEVTTDGALALTVTQGGVADPASHNGVYTRDIDGNPLDAGMLAAGPQCLVAVAVAVQDGGTPEIGTALIGTAGLWLHDIAKGVPVVTYQWFRDGAAIPGATGPIHVLQTADGGNRLTLVETAADAGGARSCISGGIAVPAAPQLSVTPLGDGTLEVVAEEDGDLAVTIADVTDPATYNGVYTSDVDGNALDAGMLAAGPQCLVAVAVTDDGTPAVGEILTGLPGLWLHDSANSAPTLAYQWFRDGAAIPGATGPSYTPQAADAGTALTLVEAATDANGTRTATSRAVGMPGGGPTLAVTRLGGFQVSAPFTATPAFDIDTSSLAPGDDIYFAYGPNQYAASATVGGNPATKLSTDVGGAQAGGRLAVFRYTLQPGDIGGPRAVRMTLPAAANTHVFDSWHVVDGTFNDSEEGFQTSGSSAVTVNPVVSGPSNAVLAWCIAREANSVTFSGVTEMDEAALAGSATFVMAVGLAENAPAGALAVSATPDVSSRLAVVAVSVEG